MLARAAPARHPSLEEADACDARVREQRRRTAGAHAALADDEHGPAGLGHDRRRRGQGLRLQPHGAGDVSVELEDARRAQVQHECAAGHERQGALGRHVLVRTSARVYSGGECRQAPQ